MPAQQKAPYALRDGLIIVYAADPSDQADKRGPRRDAATRVCTKIDYNAKYILDKSFKIPAGLAADGFPLRRWANKLSGVKEQRCYSTEELCEAIDGVVNTAAPYALYTEKFHIGRSTLKAHVKAFKAFCAAGPPAHLVGKMDISDPASLKKYKCVKISLPGRSPFNTLDEERVITARLGLKNKIGYGENRNQVSLLLRQVGDATGTASKGSTAQINGMLKRVNKVNQVDGKAASAFRKPKAARRRPSWRLCRLSRTLPPAPPPTTRSWTSRSTAASTPPPPPPSAPTPAARPPLLRRRQPLLR